MTIENMSTEEFLVSLPSNPLVLLLVGAAISGFLVPHFTRKWQDGQQELTLKVGLIENIATSITEIVRGVESTEAKISIAEKNKSKILTQFKKKDQELWHKACPEIGSQIHTYFHRSKRKIPVYWENYKDLVNELCKLTEEDDTKKRICSLEEINKYINNINNTKTKKIDLIDPITDDELNMLAYRSQNVQYNFECEKLRRKIFNMKHELMQHIIESNMAGFSEGFPKIDWSILIEGSKSLWSRARRSLTFVKHELPD